jgi:hypothetical protein
MFLTRKRGSTTKNSSKSIQRKNAVSMQKKNQIIPIKRAPNVNTTVQPDGGMSPAHGSADDDAMAE